MNRPNRNVRIVYGKVTGFRASGKIALVQIADIECDMKLDEAPHTKIIIDAATQRVCFSNDVVPGNPKPNEGDLLALYGVPESNFFEAWALKREWDRVFLRTVVVYKVMSFENPDRPKLLGNDTLWNLEEQGIVIPNDDTVKWQKRNKAGRYEDCSRPEDYHEEKPEPPAEKVFEIRTPRGGMITHGTLATLLRKNEQGRIRWPRVPTPNWPADLSIHWFILEGENSVPCDQPEGFIPKASVETIKEVFSASEEPRGLHFDEGSPAVTSVRTDVFPMYRVGFEKDDGRFQVLSSGTLDEIKRKNAENRIPWPKDKVCIALRRDNRDTPWKVCEMPDVIITMKAAAAA